MSVAHATPLDQTERDFVAVAERLVGTPYLWGGRTSFGLDCSALLQQSLAAAGIACPRDSDMIEREIGNAIDPRELVGTARRGDRGPAEPPAPGPRACYLPVRTNAGCCTPPGPREPP